MRLAIFALFTAFVVANGYLVRVDIQMDDVNFGLVRGRMEILFTFKESSGNKGDYFSIPNQESYT